MTSLLTLKLGRIRIRVVGHTAVNQMTIWAQTSSYEEQDYRILVLQCDSEDVKLM